MQKVLDELDSAIQVEQWVEMPRDTYAEDRKFNFEMLARTLNIRVLELRVALSNIWLVMMARNNLWRDRAS